VVNVGSIAAHVPVRGETVYAATKWGLAGFTESLRSELAGTGVGVTFVSPGVVRTAFFDRRGAPYRRSSPRPIDPRQVGMAIVRAVERDQGDVFVPGWMAFPARLRGAVPGLYRRLAARFE
jgi:short-subunit dehydrogenase